MWNKDMNKIKETIPIPCPYPSLDTIFLSP